MGKAIVNVVIVFAVLAALNYMLPREQQGIMWGSILIPWCAMVILPYSVWRVGKASSSPPANG